MSSFEISGSPLPNASPAPALLQTNRILYNPDLAVVAVLVVLAFGLRIVNLGFFPDTLSPDEADNAQDAIRAFAGAPPENGLFGLDWKPQPAFSIYLMGLFIAILGPNAVAIRLPSAILSSLAVIPFYFLLRRRFSIWTSTMMSLLLISNLWFLNFSRSGWENSHIALYMLGSVLFFLRGVDGIKASDSSRATHLRFAATGLFAALGLYGYFSGRAIILSLVVLFPVVLWHLRRRWRTMLVAYAIMCLTCLILFLPQVVATSGKWEHFNRRSQTVLITNSDAFKQEPASAVASQLQKNAVGLWWGAVNHTARYTPDGEPLMDTVTGALVALGLVASLACKRARDSIDNWVVWGLVLVSWVMTQVITSGTPDGARGVGWMPMLMYFGATAIEMVIAPTQTALNRHRAALAVAMTVLVVSTGLLGTYQYFQWQSKPSTREARAPYLSVQEVDQWAAAIVDRATRKQGVVPVGAWRQEHPLVADVSGGPLQQAQASTLVFSPAITPRDEWPHLQLTLGGGGDIPGALVEPRSVAVGADGSIYVVDSSAQAQMVSRFSSSGKFLGRWGGPGESDGRFASAWAVAVAPDQSVLVLDETTCWVHVFDAQGTFLRKWGGPDTGMYHPRAMSVDLNGDVLVADTGRGRVVRFNREGVRQAEYGNAPTLGTADRLLEPSGVTAGTVGGIWVADAPAQLLRLYDGDGRAVSSIPIAPATAMDGPRVTLAPDSTIYVTDPRQNRVLRFDQGGRPLPTFGDPTAKDYLDLPASMAFGADGKIFVSELRSGLVKVFRP